ncbi:phosphopantetheine-binding protein [Streptomyces sp. NPDC052301]|uniref:phosphopantetheine-binding protein n=1 Tax=Streptomyces sp. NPDC052301 TaxID=3365687 RepID=UPI0037CF3F78
MTRQDIRLALGELDAHRLRALVERCGAAGGAAAGGGHELVAVYVPRPDTVVDAEELRGFLAARLPGEYVPTRFVAAAELPLLPSGKIDQRALGRIAAATAEDRDRGDAPGTDTEQWIAGVWRDVLGVESVRTRDDFFALGGNSLRAIRMISQIEEVLGRRPAVRSIFDFPSLAAYARAVEELAADVPEFTARVALAAEVYGLDDAAVAERLAERQA